MSINTNASVGKVAFGLVRNTKSLEFPKENLNWDRLVNKYALHTASSLLKLKSKCQNSKLELINKDPDEWISNLEGLQIFMNEFRLKGKIIDEDFIIQMLNDFQGI